MKLIFETIPEEYQELLGRVAEYLDSEGRSAAWQVTNFKQCIGYAVYSATEEQEETIRHLKSRIKPIEDAWEIVQDRIEYAEALDQLAEMAEDLDGGSRHETRPTLIGAETNLSSPGGV